jgi:hypothetical protein
MCIYVTVLVERHEWVEGEFPVIVFDVSDIAMITAPKHFLWFL